MKLFNTLIVIILLSLFGCNSLNDYQLIERGETVTIDYENSRADEAGRISNQAIATDTGVASGAILGAAWGLTCGPFFWLCSPLGALAGATTGATAGFVVGVLESLPEEKVQALSDQITGYLTLQDPQQQFMRPC
ncbi:MAG: hypothetical protein O2971_14180 [Proteobacteria bacterium]|nr:hypothetical protein [Pseudomonadota bacterium]